VVGVDDDLGFRVLRVTRDEEWQPHAWTQVGRALLLALLFLTATSDNAPETASEHRFRNASQRSHVPGAGNDMQRRGLATAILASRR
jgi:hypothetical protein